MDPSTNVDEVWRSLGKFGKYQCFQIAIVLFTIFTSGFQLLTVVFIGYRPDHQCAPIFNSSGFDDVLNNDTYIVKYKKCTVRVYKNHTNETSLVTETGCPNGHRYSLPKDATFVTEMDLVCENAGLAELTQTLTMTGQLVGAATASSLSDRYGRKTVHMFSNIGLLVCGMCVAHSINYTMLIIFRFITGVFQQGIVMAGHVLFIELLPKEIRFIKQIAGALFWPTGNCIMALTAYLFRDYSWRYLHTALTCYASYSLIQYWIQDESVRWLLVNNRTKEADIIVRKAAKWNNVSYDKVIQTIKAKEKETKSILELEVVVKQENENSVNVDESPEIKNTGTHLESSQKEHFAVERYNALSIFKNRKLSTNSVILWFTWITTSLTYFGLTLTATSLAGNRFLNYFLIASADYGSIIFEYIMIKRIGRRAMIVVFHAVSGISLVLATTFAYFGNEGSTMIKVSIFFTFLGKVAISGAFSSIFMFTPELYPTNLRNVGLGLSSCIARTGGMLAPFAGMLATYISWAPGAIFSTMCIIVTIIIFQLPETKGVELPSSMKELKSWYMTNSRETPSKIDHENK